MDMILNYIHFILHINTALPLLLQNYGDWVYGLVFLIIFLESGIILLPILPGESMLFALGAVAAVGQVQPHNLIFLLATAALLGGFVNYALGYLIGEKFLSQIQKPTFKKGMQKTTDFYDKYGAKAILLGRLVPIVRTYVPFFAGSVKMRFNLFALFNIIGALLWIAMFIYIGFFFGEMTFVQTYFTWFVLAIIILSIMPISIEVLKNLRKRTHEPAI